MMDTEQLVYSTESLGNAIKRQRKAQNLTQVEAGTPFSIDQTTVSSIEQGRPGTHLETIFRILAALNLEMVIRPKKSSLKQNNEHW